MSYSDLYFQSKRNNKLGIIAAVVVVSFALFLYYTQSNTTPLKAVDKVLKRHEIVNLAQHEAGIFWVSDKKETGWVLYGISKSDLSLTASEERDVGEKKNSTYLHYVPLKGLKENQEYFYKIVSGNEVIIGSDKEPFTFKTAKNSTRTSTIKPAYGKVTLANGQSAQNAFVIYNYKNAYPFLTLTKLTGEWLIPLQFAVNKNTLEELPMSEKEKIKIEILSEDSANSVIEALVKKTNPLNQTTVLGKNYKFLEDDNILPASTQRVAENKEYPISIILPKEKALIPGSRPLLKGLGLPGKQVKIEINSQPGYISRITVDKKGEWKVEVPVSLIAGTYTMTVNTENSTGKNVTLTRKFSIAKSGEQVLGVASPSATLSPSISPTEVITPTTAITITEAISPVISDIPLFTVTPVTSATATLITPLPTSGFNANTILYGSIGLIIVGVGMMMVF